MRRVYAVYLYTVYPNVCVKVRPSDDATKQKWDGEHCDDALANVANRILGEEQYRNWCGVYAACCAVYALQGRRMEWKRLLNSHIIEAIQRRIENKFNYVKVIHRCSSKLLPP